MRRAVEDGTYCARREHEGDPCVPAVRPIGIVEFPVSFQIKVTLRCVRCMRQRNREGSDQFFSVAKWSPSPRDQMEPLRAAPVTEVSWTAGNSLVSRREPRLLLAGLGVAVDAVPGTPNQGAFASCGKLRTLG